MKRWTVRRLVWVPLGVFLSGAVFSTVCTLIWPQHWPSWVTRVTAVVFLVGLALAVAGLALTRIT